MLTTIYDRGEAFPHEVVRSMLWDNLGPVVIRNQFEFDMSELDQVAEEWAQTHDRSIERLAHFHESNGGLTCHIDGPGDLLALSIGVSGVATWKVQTIHPYPGMSNEDLYKAGRKFNDSKPSHIFKQYPGDIVFIPEFTRHAVKGRKYRNVERRAQIFNIAHQARDEELTVDELLLAYRGKIPTVDDVLQPPQDSMQRPILQAVAGR